jgi:membrane-anchored protein YejM (alkaline phosphatase superfamily)
MRLEESIRPGRLVEFAACRPDRARLYLRMSSNSIAERSRLMAQFWLVNIFITCLVCIGYVRQAPEVQSLGMWIFLYLGLLASSTCLALLPGLLLQLLARFLSLGKLHWIATLFWTLVLLLIYIDTKLYGIFRYHFNSMVWNVMTTPGADDAVHITSGDKAILFSGIGGLLLVEWFLFRFLMRAQERRREDERPVPRLLRPKFVWLWLILPCLLLVTGTYAQADLVRDRRVMGLARIYPVYPRVTIKRLAVKWFGYVLADRPRVKMAAGGILLDYPKQKLNIDPNGPRPNIVILVIDSLRADMLSEENMPITKAFAAEARVFQDHLSGGNATRFGIFSMLYGLHGSYWKPIYNEQRSPVLVDSLLELGYSMKVLSSASMDYPEFRSTAWVNMEEEVEDRLKDKNAGKDDAVARRFEEWLDEPGIADGPFFNFMLLDAPHQGYKFPPEFEKFTPFIEKVSYFDKSGKGTPQELEELMNRYRNAVLYSDSIAGRVIEALKSRGLFENTILCITGDHGEEFFENGFFGHTSNFTREQVHVPFLLSGPGIEVGIESGPTSHTDLPTTLLELLGADPAARSDWTLGDNLLAPDADRFRISSGWDDLALYVPEAILHVPMSAYQGSAIDVYDYSWKLFDDPDAIFDQEGYRIGTLALECRRFLR